ncbi:MAG TPA: two-component regulator propeller domain-containing protein [Pyrinomonadaceae bacterium]|nr:two-component regulator propeller domain-containing protein [Pyrinomonadaceae bacterium]
MRYTRDSADVTGSAVVVALMAAVLFVSCSAARAVSRVQHSFDATNGLTVPTVFSLAQDGHGFIWIGTAGGLVRFDGVEMRRWAKETISRDISVLAVSASGEIVFGAYAGDLYRVTNDGVEILPCPDSKALASVRDAMFDAAQGLWVVSTDGALRVRDKGNTWHLFDSSTAFPGERVRQVRPASGNQVFVITDKAVWRAAIDQAPQKVVDVQRAVDVVKHSDGSIFVLVWGTRGEVIQHLPSGQSRIRASLAARPIDLTVRGDTVWASFDRFLISLRGEDPPDIIGPDQDLPSGGPLLVDHESSLWLGTLNGLLQYPEPETKIWTQADGLSTSHTRNLALAADGVWVGTWGWLGFIDNDGHARSENRIGGRVPCIDSRGFVWASSEDRNLVTNENGSFTTRTSQEVAGLHMCAQSHDGSLWLATNSGLFRARENDQRLEKLASPAGENGTPESVIAVLEDRERRLWITTSAGSICSATIGTIDAVNTGAWACQVIATYTHIFGLIQMPSGDIWAATSRAGLWRFHRGGWEPHPASQGLASPSVFSLRESAAGGVWVLGNGISMRVVERTDLAEGWQVLERLSSWHGLPGEGASDLVEAPDGTLWLATAEGVIRVPKSARGTEHEAPRVRLVEARINGSVAPTNAGQELPNGSQAELHFAALSYRDRGRLQFQYRLKPDAAWIDWRDNSGVLRFVDLGAGEYRAEVRASLDGKNWSAVPARLSFQVLKPWYLQTWALVLFMLIIASILYLIYRTRIAVLIRLERQRAQIARDLHDEMGSGLGSIGILSGVAAENNLNAAEHQELSRKIAQTASELGTTLTEIVWALKPGTETLEALAYYLAERGGRLFPGTNPTFKTEFPARWPHVNLSLAVRRNILLIASEALHNAARHADARNVTLGIEPSDGKWRLWLKDDGRGLSEASVTSNGSGIGLDSMRRRAEEIGAQISWTSNNGVGTLLSIAFDPGAEDRRFR